uniref:Uncharacterized protein n=1 Tax=Aegilops tauschii subsp. strangulata TaxID=200361 RepID=A0A453H931_AEGTS
LLIVADGPHIPGMEEQEWVEDGTAAGPEGERKEGGEPGKTGPMPGGRIGYSGGGPGFHPQHHSMFKVSYSGQEAVRCSMRSAHPQRGRRRKPRLQLAMLYVVVLCKFLIKFSFFLRFFCIPAYCPTMYTVNAIYITYKGN